MVSSLDEQKEFAINSYVRLCSDMYFGYLGDDLRDRFKALSDETCSESVPEAKPEHATLETVLDSKNRCDEVIDNWTPLDIGIMISAVSVYGRDMDILKTYLPRKSAYEIADFYYGVWKGTRSYKQCKKARKDRCLV